MKNRCNNTLVLLMTLAISSIGMAQIQKAPKVSKESEIDRKTYTGIISEQYANGSPSLWKNLVEGKSEGLWLEWYPDGTLRYRAYWENNLGHGKWEYFYSNGQLRSESFYINDIAQGLFKSYHENGQLKVDAVYIDGKKEGVETIYDVNGIVLLRKFYKNGQQVIDAPVLFEEGIFSSLSDNEWGVDFMPDGNTAYFTRRDTKTNEKRIYECIKTENGWNTPTIASFSTDEDEGVFINASGTILFFASYRPLPDSTTTEEMDMNLWFVERNGAVWSDPKPLSNRINKSMQADNIWPANYEAGPMTDSIGNLYYWTKGTKTDATNLYFAELKKDGSYAKPIALIPPSNDKYYDTSPLLSPDGNILFFGSDDRDNGYGGSDLYYSVKKDGEWSEPKNLGPIINSSSSEGCPSFSPDGKYFYFSSNRGETRDANGEKIWNLYYIESEYLLIED